MGVLSKLNKGGGVLRNHKNDTKNQFDFTNLFRQPPIFSVSTEEKF